MRTGRAHHGLCGIRDHGDATSHGDAAAYDAGYLAVEEISGRVKLRGRGGTMLQPGISLLERADDFPTGAPILVITDAYCDVLRIRREHAFLVPEGARLPFTPRGPVFRVTPDA